MKKLLILFAAAFALSGCVKEETINRKIFDCIARSNDWRAAPTGGSYPDYYYCDFEIPEINDFLYNNGTVVAYYEYYDGNNRQVQTALPCVTPNWGDINDPSTKWTEITDYEYERGWFRIRVVNDNFYYGNPPQNPGNRVYRLVIIW